MLLVASVLGILARALVLTSEGVSRMTSTGNINAVLQEEGESALREIIADLRRSGIHQGEVNGTWYPYYFEDGVADAPFTVHSHPPADSEADADDSDFGPNREIVFVLPSDLDDDGRPDVDTDDDLTPELDGDGDGTRTDSASDTNGIWDPARNTVHPESGVVWSHDEISYVVITGPDGVNYLERRVNGDPASGRRIARYVERVVFEDAAAAGITDSLESVRVRIFLRKRDDSGLLFRRSAEVWVKLRNGMSEADRQQGIGV